MTTMALRLETTATRARGILFELPEYGDFVILDILEHDSVPELLRHLESRTLWFEQSDGVVMFPTLGEGGRVVPPEIPEGAEVEKIGAHTIVKWGDQLSRAEVLEMLAEKVD